MTARRKASPPGQKPRLLRWYCGPRQHRAQRAPDRKASPLNRMRIDLGGGHVCVPELVLDGPDIGAAFQQMRGEGMAQGVAWRRCSPVGEIMRGLQFGEAYAFDEEAYNRFYSLASKAGLGLGAEDFSQPSPAGMHFVRVQLTGAS